MTIFPLKLTPLFILLLLQACVSSSLNQDKLTQTQVPLTNEKLLAPSQSVKRTKLSHIKKPLPPKKHSKTMVKKASRANPIQAEKPAQNPKHQKTKASNLAIKSDNIPVEKPRVMTIPFYKIPPPIKPLALPPIEPEIFAPARLNHPLQYTKKLHFMIGEDSEGFYLYAEGPILEGAFDKFKNYVEHYKSQNIKLNRFMMNSPGGFLHEGLKIAHYIHENKWTTDADKHMKCYSSCGFIYAAGVNKRIQKGAEIGFHRPYIKHVPDTPSLIHTLYEKYKPDWEKIKGSPLLYDHFMKSVGRDDMYILTVNNISNYMNAKRY